MKKAKGNMYDWVTHTHAHIGGECPHKCSYCYVDNSSFGRSEKYKGDVCLLESEFKSDFGKGNIIFIDHMNDLFANDVPKSWIELVFKHCNKYPDNTYVFQSKNPKRFLEWDTFPVANAILGTTIESNVWYPEIMGKSPTPIDRFYSMCLVRNTKFLTIEPILDFDLDEFSDWVRKINPKFVNIGADSKGHDLPEPTYEKILELAERINSYGIEIRKKINLDRLQKVTV